MENFEFINSIRLDNQPTENQSLIAWFYDSLSSQFEQLKMRAFMDDAYGDGYCGYYLLMDMELLLIYLLMLNRTIEQARVEATCGIITSEMKQTIIQAWKLDCIRKTFLCKGIKVDSVLKIDILPAYQVFDVAVPTGDRGVGYMFIEGSLDQDDCSEDKETFFIS